MALYRERIDDQSLEPDPAQSLVVEKLNLLFVRLNRASDQTGGFAAALFGWGREKVTQESLKGLYIYGDVGRGKSMLMQLFVDAMGTRAWRVHFHEFMQDVQKQLAEIRKGKTKDPLDEIAARIAKRADVLCLDEMQVENIADAMIVGRLFAGIFERGVVLVTTSNRHPDALYKGGLNRQRFVPFIDEIKTHCEIVSLDGERDYRGANGDDQPASQRFFVNDKKGFERVWKDWPGQEKSQVLSLAGRDWELKKTKKGAANLSFSELCETARGAQDYQALAANVQTIFISDVPRLQKENTSAAQRFVTLIDILYEEKSALYLSLRTPLDALHDDQETGFVFARTLSRLSEMGQDNWPDGKNKN